MNSVKIRIKKQLHDSAYIKLLVSSQCLGIIEKICEKIIRAFKNKKRLFIFGNGGSAADAQHVACELQGKFYKTRVSLPAIALTTNTSVLTAVGNDFGFDQIFSRQIEAYVKKGDIVIAISTSGNSPNIIKAIEVANRLGAITIAFTGKDGGKLKNISSVCLKVPSNDVARIQECHITIGHIICDIIETALFPKNK